MVKVDPGRAARSNARRAKGRQDARTQALYWPCGGSVLLVVATWWFSNHYDRALTGYTICWLVVAAGLIGLASVLYAMSGQKTAQRNGYVDICYWCAESGLAGLLVTTIYHAQSGGLNINGMEASVAFVVWFVFCLAVQAKRASYEQA